MSEPQMDLPSECSVTVGGGAVSFAPQDDLNQDCRGGVLTVEVSQDPKRRRGGGGELSLMLA